MNNNDPQTFTRVMQAQRDADREFDELMRKWHPTGPRPVSSPRLSEFGRGVLVLIAAVTFLAVVAWASQGVPIEVMSVDVARGTE